MTDERERLAEMLEPAEDLLSNTVGLIRAEARRAALIEAAELAEAHMDTADASATLAVECCKVTEWRGEERALKRLAAALRAKAEEG